MAHAMMFSLFAVLATVGICHGNNFEHFVGQNKNGDQVPMDLAISKEKMITKFESTLDDADSFRETTNLFDFNRELVAIRDDASKICYVQHTDLTHREVMEMISSLDKEKDDTALEVEEEDILISGLPNIVNPAEVGTRFGEEIVTHCLSHEVYYLDGDDRIKEQGGIRLITKRAVVIRIRVRVGPVRITIRIRIGRRQ